MEFLGAMFYGDNSLHNFFAWCSSRKGQLFTRKNNIFNFELV